MTAKFDQPYFITPHAVQRFRERVADLPREEIIDALQGALQNSTEEEAWLREEGDLAITRSARYNGKALYIPTLYPGKFCMGVLGSWPVAMTVMTEDHGIHWRLKRQNNKKPRPKPWTEEDTKLLKLLRREGYGIRKCARLMGRGHTTVHRHLDEPRRVVPRWTEEEKEYAISQRARGRSYGEVAKKVSKKFGTERSYNAVKLFFYRHRKRIKDDPQKMAALKVLAFCTNPGKVLAAARKYRMLDLALEEEINL